VCPNRMTMLKDCPFQYRVMVLERFTPDTPKPSVAA